MPVFSLKVHGHQSEHIQYYIHFIHLPKSAEFSDNFYSNISAQRFVNTDNGLA